METFWKKRPRRIEEMEVNKKGDRRAVIKYDSPVPNKKAKKDKG